MSNDNEGVAKLRVKAKLWLEIAGFEGGKASKRISLLVWGDIVSQGLLTCEFKSLF